MLAVVLSEAAVPVLAPLTAPVVPLLADDFLLEVFLLAVTICFMTLLLPGVTLEVQYQLPFANAQACPSFAVAYVSVCPILFSNGSSKSASPLVLLSDSAVSRE